jgi:CHAD domain
VKARSVKKLDPARPLGENAARIVKVRLDELLAFSPKALDREAIKAQHDMRIAAKRLRYVLEVTGFSFGRPADTARRRARDLQDILGEMHDCDVMLPRVQSEVERLRGEDARALLLRAGDADDLDPGLVAHAPNRTLYRGLELLAVHLRARRALLFERFRRLWQAEVSKQTWAKLERALDLQLNSEQKERESPPPKDTEPAPRETARARSHSAS